jgi:hypothetical protein
MEDYDSTRLNNALAAHAANPLRVVAQGGSGWDVLVGMRECIALAEGYREKRGQDPGGDNFVAISLDGGTAERDGSDRAPKWMQAEAKAKAAAEWDVCRAALRLVAARLNPTTGGLFSD